MLYRASCPVPGCGGRIEYLATIGDDSADKLNLDAVELERVRLEAHAASCGCGLTEHDILVARENVQDELRGLLQRRETAPWVRWSDLEWEMLDRMEARQ